MIKRRTFAFLGIAFLLFAGLAPAFSSCGLAEFLSFPDKFPYYTEDLDSYLDDMEKYGEGEISFPTAMIPLHIPKSAELVGFSTENEWGIAAEIVLALYIALANVVYIACDILYKRLSILYLKKFREKIHKLLK